MVFIWQIGPWFCSSDSLCQCARSSQGRINGLQVPWNFSVSLTPGHTLGSRISVHEANVDLLKEIILESQAENKALGGMRG